ncbi:hypothetical protein [Clostridium sardiniense]|uniref:hypothetical protein n=1 Tax=Clostridium sardiniense TaxID=29369 RepID=UPI003D33CEEB
MARELEVELNFPKDMKILEEKMGQVLGEIIRKKYGPEMSMRIADELEKRLES